MAAYGLYSQSSRTSAGRSCCWSACSRSSISWSMRARWSPRRCPIRPRSLICCARRGSISLPRRRWATIGTVAWIVIAYYFHQSMIDAVTGGREVTRPNSRGSTICWKTCAFRAASPCPKLKVMESDALNAFATGMNEKQYAITVTTALLARLDDAEMEAVLGHELTHIRNGDVRMMVVAVIIAGAIAFFAELFFRLWFNAAVRFGSRRSSGRGPRPGRQCHRDRHRGRAGRGRLAVVRLIRLRAVAHRANISPMPARSSSPRTPTR